MNITIKIIPHKKQRYPTVGDWYFDKKGNLQIRVSSMKDWKYETLVALHELIEVVLCKDRGITQEETDKFDIEFEKNRPKGNTEEPGNQPNAPYHSEHKYATEIERSMAQELNVEWESYDNTINSL
jgi:hypothetical protein